MDTLPFDRGRLGLTTSQAADALGVSIGTIRRWSDLGYLRSRRTPGGQRRFSQEHIDEFVAGLRTGFDRPVSDDRWATG